MKNGSIAEFLESARVLIENARDVPFVAQAVAAYGYDGPRIQEGLATLVTAQTLVSRQAQDYGEAYEATEALNRTWEADGTAYTRALKVARVAFGSDPRAAGALKLPGRRKESLVGWLEQTTPFYDNLLSDSALAATMASHGYPESRLREEQKLVAAVRQAVNLRLKESGEAQSATVARDKALDVLDAWVIAFKAICRVALADDPQQLEKLGVVVLNQSRRRSKTKV